eukprot:Clim_evm18s216 gene=Clim_evmTU18s216
MKFFFASVAAFAIGVAARDLTILHTNDIHAHYVEFNKFFSDCNAQESADGNCFGGMARIKTKVDEIRATKGAENVLLLDGGDQFQGTLIFTVFEGLVAAQMMEAVGYDAMGLGNHEFDLGTEVLRKNLLDNISFRALSANMVVSPEEPNLTDEVWDPSTVLTMADGFKVGIVGFTTPETNFIASPGPYVEFVDMIPAIQTEVDALIAKGVRFIIALGHGGILEEISIAEQVSGVDLVVGGHTNTFLYTGEPPSSEEPYGEYPLRIESTAVPGKIVYVVQDFTFGKYLGHLELSIDDATGEITGIGADSNPILLDAAVVQDQSVLDLLGPIMDEVEEFSTVEVGRTVTNLDGDTAFCRREECSMGNLIADAWVDWHVNSLSDKEEQAATGEGNWNIAPIALANGGSIRSSLGRGHILVGDIISVQPFRGTLTLLRMKGSILREAIEFAYSAVNDLGEGLPGRFFQVSGLRVIYDSSRPEGEPRLISLEARCGNCLSPSYSPVDDDQMYDVVTTNFIADGGDGFEMFERDGENVIALYEQGGLDSDVLQAYIGRHSNIWRDRKEGRIYDVAVDVLPGGQTPGECPNCPECNDDNVESDLPDYSEASTGSSNTATAAATASSTVNVALVVGASAGVAAAVGVFAVGVYAKMVRSQPRDSAETS